MPLVKAVEVCSNCLMVRGCISTDRVICFTFFFGTTISRLPKFTHHASGSEPLFPFQNVWLPQTHVSRRARIGLSNRRPLSFKRMVPSISNDAVASCWFLSDIWVTSLFHHFFQLIFLTQSLCVVNIEHCHHIVPMRDYSCQLGERIVSTLVVSTASSPQNGFTGTSVEHFDGLSRPVHEDHPAEPLPNAFNKRLFFSMLSMDFLSMTRKASASTTFLPERSIQMGHFPSS